MSKLILSLLVMSFSLPAFADTKNAVDTKNDSDTAVTAPPGNRRIVRDGKYIYITEPLRLTFDNEQSQALENLTQMLSTQIGDITTQYDPQMDPKGDLKVLVDTTKAFNGEVDSLIQLASGLYGNANTGYTDWAPYVGAKMVPTGFIIFGAAEYDKNLISIPYLNAVTQGGGSVTVGIVLVPQKVTRIPIPQAGVTNKEAAVTYTSFSTSLVVIPTVNAGVGVSTIGGGGNMRGGLGFIFGDLDSAADVVGWTGGASATFDAPGLAKYFPSIFKADGVNVKVLAIKNSAKPGAVTNVMALVGLEQGVVASPKNTTLFAVNLESHLNVSYIWDFTTFFGNLSKTAAGIAKKVSGTDGN